SPFTAHHLFALSKYVSNVLLTRANPAGWIETSRGCVFDCGYCNKEVHGRTFRKKSTERVLDDIERMLKAGYREIHIADDGFTTDLKRAANICESIIKSPFRFPWSCVNGIRVDRVDQELLNIMARAGCYRISFGIESGNQQVLNDFGKKVSLDQIRKAVEMAKKAGMEVFGYFMLALPTDNESSMKDTLKFATSLDLDLAKVSVTIPFPGTPFYQYYSNKGQIKTNDWSLYNVYKIPRKIYDHSNLSWDTVEAFYKRFYRDFYFRPSYVIKRFGKALREGHLLSDLKAFFLVKWF
ncbi:MAG: radical SAM protein, partial [Nitrospirae bacterium]|nr:radical SAM protein [Nitrospirota bacterium]